MEDYEKKYNEALDRAKIYSEGHTLDVNPQVAMEYVFPELRESKEEKIRNTLIDLFKNRLTYYGTEKLKDLKVDDILAWLEKQGEKLPAGFYYVNSEGKKFYSDTFKYGDITLHVERQGEQKHADKVEPKFKVGDWIISSEGKLRHIVDVDKTGYQTDNGWLSHELYEKRFHLWTIQDAKDGDVLVYGDNPEDYHSEVIMLFKSQRSKYSAFTHFHIFDDEFRTDDWCDCGLNAHPATKEQRDLLFQKIKESGYMWDFEKKKLNKIEQKMINEHIDLRYQLYSLKKDGNLDKPITIPMTKEKANKYFSDCVQCAIVSIDEHGSIVEIIEKNTELIKTNKINKPKTIK